MAQHRKTDRHATGAADEEMHVSGNESRENRAPGRGPASREGPSNEQAAEAPQESAEATDAAYARMKHAEEMVDRIGERVGYYTTQLGHGLLRLAARAREEFEDIVAEAQSIRQHKGP